MVENLITMVISASISRFLTRLSASHPGVEVVLYHDKDAQVYAAPDGSAWPPHQS